MDKPDAHTDETHDPSTIETRLDDVEGEAADLQPVRSVDQEGNIRQRRTRKRGAGSTNPHASSARNSLKLRPPKKLETAIRARPIPV